MLKVMRNTITMAATTPIAAKTPPARGLFCRKDEGIAVLFWGLLVAPEASELEVLLGPVTTVTTTVLELGRVLVDSDGEEGELLVEDDRLVVVEVVDVVETVEDEVELTALEDEDVDVDVDVDEDEDSVAVLEARAVVEDEATVAVLWPGGRIPLRMLPRLPPAG